MLEDEAQKKVDEEKKKWKLKQEQKRLQQQQAQSGQPPQPGATPPAPPFGKAFPPPSKKDEGVDAELEGGEQASAPSDLELEEEFVNPYQQDIDALKRFFRKPSTEYDWSSWLRASLEDLLVCDGWALYPRPTLGGGIYSLDLIDVATIKKLVDDTGRTPAPPLPAYQQVLHGVVASNYTADELDYFIRNPRTYRLYGRSPVEWIITTVNTAIRRALHQVQYYTEGNVPEVLATAPEGWTMEQIREFQMYWDATMEGNTAERRHMKVVPFDASKIKETKTVDLKDMFDEWIARLVCFAFGISPSFLIRDQNRATAETVHEQSVEEGLMPILNFVAAKMTYIIQYRFGFEGLKWKWNLEDDIDAQVQANIDKMATGHPLNDEDRWPWLERIGHCLDAPVRQGQGRVVACSALKRAYRDRLRQAAPGLRFVFLEISRAQAQGQLLPPEETRQPVQEGLL